MTIKHTFLRKFKFIYLSILFSSFIVNSCLSFPVCAYAQDAQFIHDTTDIPLLAGLTLIPQDTVLFDNPDGKILIVSTYTENQNLRIIQFYEETLPQLGWKKSREREFVREQEHLKLDIKPDDQGILVRFLLTPSAK